MKSNTQISSKNKTMLKDTNINSKYGNVVVKEIPKNYVLVIDDESVEILHKSKVIKVENDMVFIVKGKHEINASKINLSTSDGNEYESVISLEKLTSYMETRLGNFGQLLFPDFRVKMESGEFGYDNIKIEKNS